MLPRFPFSSIIWCSTGVTQNGVLLQDGSLPGVSFVEPGLCPFILLHTDYMQNNKLMQIWHQGVQFFHLGVEQDTLLLTQMWSFSNTTKTSLH